MILIRGAACAPFLSPSWEKGFELAGLGDVTGLGLAVADSDD